MQATSGWLVSKTHGGTANDTRVWGILNASSPSASYQLGDTDDLTLKNADAYSSAFNTVLTIDQAEQIASYSVPASTSLVINATRTLTVQTVTGASNTLAGTLTVNGTLQFQNPTPAAVALNASTGVSQPQPARIYIADTSTFQTGDTVWVKDNDTPAGETRIVTGITTNTYLTVGAALTEDYTVAQSASVIRTSARALQQNSPSSYTGTVGGTGSIKGTGFATAHLYFSALALSASITAVFARLYYKVNSGGATRQVSRLIGNRLFYGVGSDNYIDNARWVDSGNFIAQKFIGDVSG
jgi:hypothetical protein